MYPERFGGDYSLDPMRGAGRQSTASGKAATGERRIWIRVAIPLVSGAYGGAGVECLGLLIPVRTSVIIGHERCKHGAVTY